MGGKENNSIDLCSEAKKDFQELSTIDQLTILSSLSQLKAETILELMTKSIVNMDINQELIDNIDIQKSILSWIDAIKGCKTIHIENIIFARNKLSEIVDKWYIIPEELKKKIFSEDIFMKFYMNRGDDKNYDKYIDYKVIWVFTQQPWWQTKHTNIFTDKYIYPIIIYPLILNRNYKSMFDLRNTIENIKTYVPKILPDTLTTIINNQNTSKELLTIIFSIISDKKDEILIKHVLSHSKVTEILNIFHIPELSKYSWTNPYIEWIGKDLQKSNDETDILTYLDVVKRYNIKINQDIISSLESKCTEIVNKTVFK